MTRDGANESIWQHNRENYQTKSTEDIPEKIFDVLIVGGGITGITTALLLQQAGKTCILAEAHTLGFGTTGGTTAHLNNFFDTPYHKVEKNFGEANAQLLARAAKEAMSLIKKQVTTNSIDCNYEERDAYLFAMNENQDKELDELVNASKKLRLPVDFINDSPFPLPYLKIACFREQAQFNPIPYIFKLAKIFEESGGIILQDCRVGKLKENDIIEADSCKGIITAKSVVYATHIPPGVNVLHFKCAPYRSYAVAALLKSGEYPKALGYDMNDPYHYYRTQNIDGKNFLIAGGEDHKAGHEQNTSTCFRRLESHLRSYFDIESIAFRWSSQYFEPADGLPYIGQLPGSRENVFVATGFGGNGMIYGTLAGIVLRDLICKNESVYKELFDPARIKPIASFGNVVKEAADVVKVLISTPFSSEKLKELADLAPGEARIVKYEGNSMAIYKDEQHGLHAVSAACTHIKCTISWNETEKSWDCPCHGSRFSIDGEVLTAPARKDLEKMNPTSSTLVATESTDQHAG